MKMACLRVPTPFAASQSLFSTLFSVPAPTHLGQPSSACKGSFIIMQRNLSICADDTYDCVYLGPSEGRSFLLTYHALDWWSSPVPTFEESVPYNRVDPTLFAAPIFIQSVSVLWCNPLWISALANQVGQCSSAGEAVETMMLIGVGQPASQK